MFNAQHKNLFLLHRMALGQLFHNTVLHQKDVTWEMTDANAFYSLHFWHKIPITQHKKADWHQNQMYGYFKFN